MTFEVIADVVLANSADMIPATSPEAFGFIITIGAESFSSAVVPSGSGHLVPGISSQVRLRFLMPEAAEVLVHSDAEFTFFEQRRTGKGRVVSVHSA